MEFYRTLRICFTHCFLLSLVLAGGFSCNTGTPSATAPGLLSSECSGKARQIHPHSYRDSLALQKIDTATVAGKRKNLLRIFQLANMATGYTMDTVFDLNFDRNDDYIIGYYGCCGTGLKNGICVYLYDPQTGCYTFDEQLSSLTNPSFYIAQKKITGFYIAHGCGGGEQLEWISNAWVCTKEFAVCNDEEHSDWEIVYPLKKDTIHKTRSYQMVPPPDILQSDYSNY